MSESTINHIVTKALDEHDGYGGNSTGERLAAALVLNRPDILKEMGYTIVEALERVGPEWGQYLVEAERRVVDRIQEAERLKRKQAAQSTP